MDSRTVFIVAHRLSTIRGVDLIYFLEGGVIAERGSNHELLKARAVMRALHAAVRGGNLRARGGLRTQPSRCPDSVTRPTTARSAACRLPRSAA